MFTVITTSFNYNINVRKYLDLICSQTLMPSEIIVVDGGSQDNTCQLIREYASNALVKIRCIQEGRLNIAEAFNIGIRETSTDYLIITCMGNSFPNTMCEDLYNEITSSKSDAAYGLLFGVTQGKFSELYNQVFITKTGNAIMSNRCVIYSKDVFTKIGFFIEDFKYAGEDAEFLMRFDKNKLKRSLVKKATVFWETPDSFKAFKKQRKDYAIAELQYAGVKYCFFSSAQIQWYLVFLSVLLFPLSFVLTLVGLSFLLLKILKYAYYYKSLKAALFREYSVLLKNYYYFRYFKYCTPKYSVRHLYDE